MILKKGGITPPLRGFTLTATAGLGVLGLGKFRFHAADRVLLSQAIKEGKFEGFQDQFIDNSLKKLYPDLNESNYDRHHEEFATILEYFEENDSDVKKLKEEWKKTYLEISRN